MYVYFSMPLYPDTYFNAFFRNFLFENIALAPKQTELELRWGGRAAISISVCVHCSQQPFLLKSFMIK